MVVSASYGVLGRWREHYEELDHERARALLVEVVHARDTRDVTEDPVVGPRDPAQQIQDFSRVRESVFPQCDLLRGSAGQSDDMTAVVVGPRLSA